MANKKLKVEVELDTAKAKQQAKSLEDLGGSTGGFSGMSSSAEKLSKSLNQAADSAGKMNTSSLGVVKAFTGIGIGLAANYAASHMKQGAARDAVEYGSSALTGASAGMMAGAALGPAGAGLGAIIGGGAGILKTYLDKEGERTKYTEDWKRSEADYANNKAFSELFRSLTDMTDKTRTFSDRVSEAEHELARYKDVEKTMLENIDKMISQGRYDDASTQRGYLAVNRQRQQQLETAIKSMDKQAKTGGVSYYSGTDALAKVGGGAGVVRQDSPITSDGISTPFHGGFFFGNSGKVDTTVFGNLADRDTPEKRTDELLARLQNQSVDILKVIADNTKHIGGATWQ